MGLPSTCTPSYSLRGGTRGRGVSGDAARDVASPPRRNVRFASEKPLASEKRPRGARAWEPSGPSGGTADVPDDDSLFRPGHDVTLEGDATVPEERLGFRALAHAVPVGMREGAFEFFGFGILTEERGRMDVGFARGVPGEDLVHAVGLVHGWALGLVRHEHPPLLHALVLLHPDDDPLVVLLPQLFLRERHHRG